MIEVLFFITLFNFGVGVGIWSKAKWDRLHPKAIEPQEKPKEVTDYTIKHALDSWVKTVEDGWKLMFPPHENTCSCVQCEIQFGPVDKRLGINRAEPQAEIPAATPGTSGSYHPDYVKELQKKAAEQKKLIDNLQAELERRDRENAAVYNEVTNTLVRKRVEVHNEEGWMERV